MTFTELAICKRDRVERLYTEFRLNRSRNTENTGRNTFTLLIKVWPSPSLLLYVTGDFFPIGKATREVKLNTHLHILLRLRINGEIPPLLP